MTPEERADKLKVERWKSKYVDQVEANLGLVKLEREARKDRATWETAYHKLEAELERSKSVIVEDAAKIWELAGALREITELDPGLWDTMQKIARKALGMEP